MWIDMTQLLLWTLSSNFSGMLNYTLPFNVSKRIQTYQNIFERIKTYSNVFFLLHKITYYQRTLICGCDLNCSVRGRVSGHLRTLFWRCSMLWIKVQRYPETRTWAGNSSSYWATIYSTTVIVWTNCSVIGCTELSRLIRTCHRSKHCDYTARNGSYNCPCNRNSCVNRRCN